MESTANGGGKVAFPPAGAEAAAGRGNLQRAVLASFLSHPGRRPHSLGGQPRPGSARLSASGSGAGTPARLPLGLPGPGRISAVPTPREFKRTRGVGPGPAARRTGKICPSVILVLGSHDQPTGHAFSWRTHDYASSAGH